MHPPTSKQCFKCNGSKPLSAFYKHSKMRDGRLNKCMDCTKRDVLVNRYKNYDRYLEYDRSRGSRGPSIVSKKQKAANSAVSNAIRDGRLLRHPCEECFSCSNIEAHHEDYSRPLDVVWLCRTCHGKRHRHAETFSILLEEGITA